MDDNTSEMSGLEEDEPNDMSPLPMPIGTWTCSVCGQTYQKKSRLESHFRSHTDEVSRHWSEISSIPVIEL
jgi:hypothetical protein